jgi:hemerythrin
MNYARWSDDLLTGNHDIDMQHKSIFAHAEQLFGWEQGGKTEDQLAITLGFFEKYVHEHLKLEEKFQRQSDYPRYDEHLQEHNEFRRRFLLIKGQFDKSGPSLQLSLRLITFTLEWLSEHIHKLDKELAYYIKHKQQTEATLSIKSH